MIKALKYLGSKSVLVSSPAKPNPGYGDDNQEHYND